MAGRCAMPVFFTLMRQGNVVTTDDSRFGRIGSEAIVVFDVTNDSRFGRIGSEAIVV